MESSPTGDCFLSGEGTRKPLSDVDAERQQGVAPSGGRGRARDFEVRFCFGYCPLCFGCDNRMNFPVEQSLRGLAGSLRRLWRQLPPGGSLAGDRWSPAAPTKIKNSVGEGSPLPLVGRKIQAKQSLRRSRASSLPEGAFFGMVRALWAGADVC